MLIILEGPDGAGKTTLANRLHEEHGLTVFHKGPPANDSLLTEYLDPLMNFGTERFYPRVVCDRWHLGERVYPHLNSSRRDSLWNREEGWYVESFLRSRGAVLVCIVGQFDELVNRLVQRGESIDTEGRFELATARDHFLTYSYKSHLSTVLIDSSQGSVEDIRSTVMRTARIQREAAESIYRRWPTYVGPTDKVQTLLVGDVRNQTSRLPFYPTAFVPHPGTSGRYLLEALPDELLLEGKLGLANVNDEGKSFRDLWERLGSPKVLAVGRHAQKGLVREDVPHGVVPHPQFVRRFAHRKKYTYGRMIVRAIDEQEDLGSWR